MSTNDSLVIKGQQINIVDDVKFLGSTILRSPKVKLNFKIRLSKAASISILLYGCESWILTEALMDKLDIFRRTCYRIMLGIKQSRDHVTNESLYHPTSQVPVGERKLKFTGHFIRMPTNEPANCFVIYESKIRSSLRPEYQGRHISIKFRPIFHLARKRSKPMK